MKKTFKSYVAIWAILLTLFNIIAFVSVGWVNQEKYTLSFWIGYIFITIAFFGQLICAKKVFEANKIQNLFYNIPLITLSWTGLIFSFVVGGLCMLISSLPYWVGVIACAVLLAVVAIRVIKASIVKDEVTEIDDKIKTNTFFIKSLIIDAEDLVSHAKSETIKSECTKVYEAVRYSDPISNSALASIENEITIKFANLSDAVNVDNLEATNKFVDEILILIKERNKKCQLLK